jgi:alanine dehydrogenase
MPLVITQQQIAKVLTMKDVVNIMEETFRLHGLKKIQLPPKKYLTFQKGDLRSMPVYIPGKMDIAGIKAVNVHPDNRKLGFPTVMATILLVDPKTGYNIAVMDGTLITDMRTGAAGGLAAKYLSRKDSKVAGFVGAGRQAYTQLEALMIVRPGIKLVKVCDLDKKKMEAFANWAKKKYHVATQICGSVKDAVKGSDIVTTVTTARAPVVKAEYVSPGTHINAIGADAAGKQELESKLTKKITIIIDDWEQASHSGEINVPFSQGLITRKNVYAELGEVVAGLKKGRPSAKAITMFDSTGLAAQDISTAYVAYKRLKAKKGIKLIDVKLF